MTTRTRAASLMLATGLVLGSTACAGEREVPTGVGAGSPSIGALSAALSDVRSRLAVEIRDPRARASFVQAATNLSTALESGDRESARRWLAAAQDRLPIDMTAADRDAIALTLNDVHAALATSPR